MGYAALRHRFRVEGDDETELARAHRLLAAFPVIDDDAADTTYTLGPDLTVDTLIGELNLTAIESVPTHLRLHAAELAVWEENHRAARDDERGEDSGEKCARFLHQ